MSHQSLERRRSFLPDRLGDRLDRASTTGKPTLCSPRARITCVRSCRRGHYARPDRRRANLSLEARSCAPSPMPRDASARSVTRAQSASLASSLARVLGHDARHRHRHVRRVVTSALRRQGDLRRRQGPPRRPHHGRLETPGGRPLARRELAAIDRTAQATAEEMVRVAGEANGSVITAHRGYPAPEAAMNKKASAKSRQPGTKERFGRKSGSMRYATGISSRSLPVLRTELNAAEIFLGEALNELQRRRFCDQARPVASTSDRGAGGPRCRRPRRQPPGLGTSALVLVVASLAPSSNSSATTPVLSA